MSRIKNGGLNVSGQKQTITEERIREIIREEIMNNLIPSIYIGRGTIEIGLNYDNERFYTTEDSFVTD